MESGGTTEEQGRLRLPRQNEVLGVVVGMLGGSRMRVACKDGKDRICRIPGKLKNTIWVKDGDIVIIKPWSIEGDKHGDVAWRYRPLHVGWLKQRGYL